MYAPSAHNQQPWEFRILQNREQQARLGANLEYGKMIPNANAVILSGFTTSKLKAPDFVQQDMGACVQNMLLTAHEKGIGAVRIGIYPTGNKEKTLNTYLNLPDDVEIFNIIALGYPDEKIPLWDKQCIKPEKIHRLK
jgi:nitroreductase